MNERACLLSVCILLVSFCGFAADAPAKSNETPKKNGEVKAEEKADKTAPAEADPANGKGKADEKKEVEKKEKKEESSYPSKAFLLFRLLNSKGEPTDSEFKFGIKLRIPEFFFGRNVRLLNDNNPTDATLYFRHTIDFNSEYRYGPPKADHNLVYVKMTIRNKGVWGDPESIASTTAQTIKEVGAVFGEHRHGIPRHILWIRELWMELALSDLMCLPFCNRHTLTFGAFPFELGRGIALGSAYATDPSDLGYFSENAIDQYAFGGKLSGEIIKDYLLYDLYAAILDNKSNSFEYTNAKIRGQHYGHLNDPARGFGIINYVTAARLRWLPTFENPTSKMEIQPYIMYNHSPEQKIEFVADAKSDLCTIGIAGEFEFGNFDCGFDTAMNFGNQRVFGWDRNIVQLANVDGSVVVNNSQVHQAATGVPTQKSPNALNVKANQNIIYLSPQSATQNGKIIGSDGLGTLINDLNRFTDPYENKFRGMMFVYDMGYYIAKPDVKVCAGFGYASGDANPNKDEEFRGDSEIDGVYEGFISLQESYSGTRVKSAFLLSGSGKIFRPLSFPSQGEDDQVIFDPFPTTVNRFTNLVFVGASAYWWPSWSCKKWRFNPNILAYWSDFSSPFFDAVTQQNVPSRFARNFLGTEINAFVEAELLPDLRFFTTAAIFFPGSFYRDIKGRPLNKAQQTFLDNEDVTGVINSRVPLVGFDKSYFINMGLEYRF